LQRHSKIEVKNAPLGTTNARRALTFGILPKEAYHFAGVSATPMYLSAAP